MPQSYDSDVLTNRSALKISLCRSTTSNDALLTVGSTTGGQCGTERLEGHTQWIRSRAMPASGSDSRERHSSPRISGSVPISARRYAQLQAGLCEA